MTVFDDLTFVVGAIPLAWGTTLAAAEVTLSHVPRLPTYGGWPELRGRCPSAYGLATTECSLRAPGRQKPVLQASYNLAPPPRSGPYVIAPDYWLRPLTQLLGPPTEAGGTAQAPDAGNVVYSATWRRPTLLISFSVYGGLRHEDGLTCAAGLFVDWQDVMAAARPLLAGLQARSAALEALAGQAAPPLLFATQQLHGPYAHPDAPDASRTATAEELRLAQRALYREDLLDTPPRVQAQLDDHGVALWALPGGRQWAVSTRWDTVLLTAEKPATDLLTLRPARGPGAELMHVGDLQLTDAYGTQGLAALAAAIEQHTGQRVSRREDGDC